MGMTATLHLGQLDVLTGHQREVAEAVLVEQGASADHIVVALSGSHAYGFPSADSDLDLKACHVMATDKLLGLSNERTCYDRLEVIDGVEIDYTSNEVGDVLAGIIAGNGNYIERVLGPHLCATSAEHAELAALTRSALSLRVHHHYRGFASGQRKALDAAAEPSAKKLLYVLRTALTGTHLLTTGQLVTDLQMTAEAHGIEGIAELIELKQAAERTVLTAAQRDRWRGVVDQVFDLLNRARTCGYLPDEPANIAEINDWLIALRRRR